MPVDSISGFPSRAISRIIGRLVSSPDATFQAAIPKLRNSSTASPENGELRKTSFLLLGMGFQSGPLLRREFHSLPIVETGFVLPAELYPPRLVGGAFGAAMWVWNFTASAPARAAQSI